jgi:threonine aldolase
VSVVDPAAVETNIVMIDTSSTGGSAAEISAAVGERGVRAYPAGKDRVRLVWHLDVDDAGTDAAIEAFREVLLTR